MTQPDAMNEPTQASCPYCLSSEGYVRQVTVKDDRRTFTFTCEDCRRTWQGDEHRIVEAGRAGSEQRLDAD
jgi:hypothetical protein